VHKVVVMVTGVGGGGFGEQIVKALRLSETSYLVHGTDMNEMSFGFDLVDRAHVVPSASEPAYIDELVGLCEEHDVDVLLPGSEAELAVLDQHRERLAETGVLLPINPSSVIATCMDKHLTFSWLRAHGHAAPETRMINDLNDLDAVDFVPAVLKPAIGGGGSANLMLAQSVDELRALGRYLYATIGPFLVQEYVGTVDSEFTVGVLTDLDGTLVDSIAVRRNIMTGLSNRVRVANRTGNHAFGASLAISSGVSQGVVGRFPEVTAECEDLALGLGARGSLNIQCRFWNGRPHVFEINPRFSGTTSIRALVGYNEPDWLIRRHLLGESLKGRIDYRTGTVLRGLSERLFSQR
jgi:carbamoyl-phosphate synthase large subunit